MKSAPSALPPHQRVAVIVAHGIADQVRGRTSADVAKQLAAAWQGTVTPGDAPIDVPRLDPLVPLAGWQPEGWLERSAMSMRQSLRSDFLDARLGEGPPAAQAEPERAPMRNSAVYEAEGAGDHSERFTDYLLAKAAAAREPVPPPAHYAMPHHQVNAPGRQADVYEMYWADQSRLGGNVTRILAELFILLFHLSKLGADTLSLADVAAGSPRALKWLARLHRAANWVFSRVLALLFLQLLVGALVLVAAAVVAAHGQEAGFAGAALAGGAIAVSVVYWGRGPWVAGFWSGVAGGGVLALGVWAQPGAAAWAVLVSGGLVLLWLYRRFLAYCEERFRAVYGVGLVLIVCTVAAIVWGASQHDTPGAGERVVAGVFRAIEVLLLVQLSAWVAMAVLVTGAVVLGEWVCRKRHATAALRQSVVTARLGLFVSMGIFVAFVMTVWALAAGPLERLVAGLHYTPWWFADMTLDGRIEAPRFLALRFSASTDTFAVVAVMLLALLGFIALVFLPSVMVELRLATSRSAQRLGHWLTAGYRALDRLVRWWSVFITLALIAVAVLLVGSQVARLGIALPWLGLVAMPVGTWSGDLLGRVVVVIAGGAVGLVAIGGVAARRLRAVRAPLDAALDVDNHFREFPRKAIPRVLILERYVALLDHVLQQRHDRVLIVAHSQGTVITADLLRYLKYRERHAPKNAPQDVWARLIEALRQRPLRLLTAGSPLRQLYALRFPVLYDWVMREPAAPQRPHAGPDPSELGLARWVNLWAAGDYVGRWLWSGAPCGDLPPLAVEETAYEGALTVGASYADECLGVDAHTHYFDLDHDRMVELLRQLA